MHNCFTRNSGSQWATTLYSTKKWLSLPRRFLPQPKFAMVTRWDKDPFSLGSYSTVLPKKGNPECLIEGDCLGTNGPLLWLAGEHVALKGWQCVHGALNTGIDAAFGVLRCSGRNVDREGIVKYVLEGKFNFQQIVYFPDTIESRRREQFVYANGAEEESEIAKISHHSSLKSTSCVQTFCEEEETRAQTEEPMNTACGGSDEQRRQVSIMEVAEKEVRNEVFEIEKETSSGTEDSAELKLEAKRARQRAYSAKSYQSCGKLKRQQERRNRKEIAKEDTAEGAAARQELQRECERVKKYYQKKKEDKGVQSCSGPKHT